MAIVKCSRCGKLYEYFEVGKYNVPYKCDKCKSANLIIPLLMVLALCILLVPLTNAQQIFKQNDITDLKIQCIINGTYCSNGAVCNVTIQYPNSSLLINNQPMTNQYSFYNYTLSSTNVLGEYLCSATCTDAGLSGTNGCNFDITPNGTIVSTGQSVIYVISLILAFSIFLLLLYGSIALPFKNTRADDGRIININHLKWLKIGAMCLAYMSLMFIFGLATAITRDFVYPIGFTKFFEWLYNIMLALTLPLAIVAIVLGFMFFLTDYVVKKKLKRGHWR